MELTTIIGLAAGISFIIYSIILDGSVVNFFDVPSIFIVLGGTFASTLVAYPVRNIKAIIPIVKKVFKKNIINFKEDVESIIKLAYIARKESILAMEDVLGDEDDPFLKKGIELIVDGTDPDMVKEILETEILYMEERHKEGSAIFDSMAAYAPAYGMIGTLIGLVNMLKNLNDSANLGPSMSVALVTTFYGVIIANLIFTPIANKLRSITKQEVLRKELLLEGMISIQNGDNLQIIREKLTVFLAKEKQEVVDKTADNNENTIKDEETNEE